VSSIGVAVAHPDPGIVDEVLHALEASDDLYLALDPAKASVVLAGGSELSGMAERPPSEGKALVGLAADHDLADVSRAALRCRAHEIVCWPHDRPTLAVILREAASRARLAARRSDGRIVAVVGARGGAGATTVAAMLARSLEAVVVDLDPVGAGQAAFLDDDVDPTLAQVLSAVDELDAQALSAAMTPHAAGVALCAAPRSEAPSARQASRLAALLRASVAVAACDLGRAADAAAREMLGTADTVVCVCAPDIASLRGARALTGATDRSMRVVLNRAVRRGIDARDVTRVLGAPPAAIVPFDAAVRRAGEAGRLPARGSARRALERFAGQLIEVSSDGS